MRSEDLYRNINILRHIMYPNGITPAMRVILTDQRNAKKTSKVSTESNINGFNTRVGFESPINNTQNPNRRFNRF